MFLRKLNILILIAALLLAYPVISQAGIFGFFSSIFKADAVSPITDKKSDCGKQIDIFKKFMHDGKICKQDDDCVTMKGKCPLGCIFYLNKNFLSIIQAEMDKVENVCSSSVCSYKCDKVDAQPYGCVHNFCQAKQK